MDAAGPDAALAKLGACGRSPRTGYSQAKPPAPPLCLNQLQASVGQAFSLPGFCRRLLESSHPDRSFGTVWYSRATVMQSTSPDTARLEKDPAVIYALDRNLRIVYCNEAWDRFAAENGGRGLDRRHQLGRLVMDVIPMPLKPFFQAGYRKVLASRQPWEHCYECSSPTVFRRFQMVVHPDPGAAGLVVVNSIIVEQLHDDQERGICFPGEKVYVDTHGIITMCCHCRRTCRAEKTAAWDWVPAYVENPPEMISHSICGVCMSLYYPG